MSNPSDVGHTTTPKHPAQSNVASERRHWRMEVGAIPPASLRGNSRAHWAAKRRASVDWHDSGYLHACESIPASAGHMKKIKITFTFHHWREIDLDNLAIGMKPFVDGITDAGIVLDDSPGHVRYGEPEFVKCKKGESKTEILIEELA